MAKNPNVKATLEDALLVLSVWKTIPDFKIGDVSLNDFNSAINSTDILAKQHKNDRAQLAGLKANRDDKVRQLSEIVTRFRSGIRAHFGPYSPLYEQAGGTRSNSRKAPKRQTEAASADTPAAPAAIPTTSAPAQHA